MKILKFILTLILSITHIHLSAYTVENLPNPLFWIIFIVASANKDENLAYFIGGIIIQSIITSIIAYFLLGWKNIKIWAGLLLLMVVLAFIENIDWGYLDYNTLIHYEPSFYRIFTLQRIFPMVVVFSVYQVLLLSLYQPVAYVLKRIEKIRQR